MGSSCFFVKSPHRFGLLLCWLIAQCSERMCTVDREVHCQIGGCVVRRDSVVVRGACCKLRRLVDSPHLNVYHPSSLMAALVLVGCVLLEDTVHCLKRSALSTRGCFARRESVVLRGACGRLR